MKSENRSENRYSEPEILLTPEPCIPEVQSQSQIIIVKGGKSFHRISLEENYAKSDHLIRKIDGTDPLLIKNPPQGSGSIKFIDQRNTIEKNDNEDSKLGVSEKDVPSNLHFFDIVLKATEKTGNGREHAKDPTAKAKGFLKNFISKFHRRISNPIKKFSFNWKRRLESFFNGENINELRAHYRKNTLEASLLNSHYNHLKIKQDYYKPDTKEIVLRIISIFGDFFQAILALFSAFVYVVSTFMAQKNEQDSTTDKEHDSIRIFVHYSEYVITAFATADLFKSWFEAHLSLKFFLHFHAIIDTIAVLPVYIELIFHVSTGFGFLHIIQIFRVMRILRLYRLFKDYAVDPTRSDVNLNEPIYSWQKQKLIFMCSILAMMFIGAGILFEFDRYFKDTYIVLVYENGDVYYDSKKMNFFLAIYIGFQSLFTLGYGDIYPNTASSRVLVMLVFIFFVVVIFDQSVKYLEIKSRIRENNFDFHQGNHIVVVGRPREGTVKRLISDFHKEFKNPPVILLVSQSEPTAEIISLLQSTSLEKMFYYLQCNIFHEGTFRKANFEKAAAVFILNEEWQNDSISKGAFYSLCNMMSEMLPLKQKIVVNFLPGTRSLNGADIIPNKRTVIVEANFIRFALMTSSVRAQGILILFQNLITRNNRNYVKKKAIKGINWALEYQASLQQDIFKVNFSPFFYGRTFKEILRLIAQSHFKLHPTKSLILIGIKPLIRDISKRKHVLINPYDFLIYSGDKAIVIASDLETARYITNFQSESENRFDKPVSILPPQDLDLIERKFMATFRKKENYEIEEIGRIYLDLWEEDISNWVSGHIIVVSPNEVFLLVVEYLRKVTQKPIFLFSYDFPGDLIKEIEKSGHRNVYFMLGNFLNIEHLRRAGIPGVEHVLIFNNVIRFENQDGSSACILANIIEEFFPWVKFSVEVLDPYEVRFFLHKPKELFKELGHQFYPNFLSGEIFVNTTIKTLAVSSLQSKLSNQVFESFFSNKIHDPSVKENKSLITIEIPSFYHGRRFEELARDFSLLTNPVITIGIVTNCHRRGNPVHSNIKGGVGLDDYEDFDLESEISEKVDNHVLELPITLTNPLPTMLIKEGDKVICVGMPEAAQKASDELLKLNAKSSQDNRQNCERNRPKRYNRKLMKVLSDNIIDKLEYQKSYKNKEGVIEKMKKEMEIMKEMIKKVQVRESLHELK